MNFKSELIMFCRDLIQQKIDTCDAAIHEAQQTANDYGPPKDRYDAFRTQLLRKKDMLSKQLAELIRERDVLNKIQTTKAYSKVEFGALVQTTRQKIFIAAGLGKIKCKEEDIVVISASVPLYKALVGKKAGHEFEFNGNSDRILAVL